MNPVGKGDSVGGFHTSRDIQVEVLFITLQRFSWEFEILTDDRELFELSETMWVVGCGFVHVVASRDPYGHLGDGIW